MQELSHQNSEGHRREVEGRRLVVEYQKVKEVKSLKEERTRIQAELSGVRTELARVCSEIMESGAAVLIQQRITQKRGSVGREIDLESGKGSEEWRRYATSATGINKSKDVLGSVNIPHPVYRSSLDGMRRRLDLEGLNKERSVGRIFFRYWGIDDVADIGGDIASRYLRERIRSGRDRRGEVVGIVEEERFALRNRGGMSGSGILDRKRAGVWGGR